MAEHFCLITSQNKRINKIVLSIPLTTCFQPSLSFYTWVSTGLSHCRPWQIDANRSPLWAVCLCSTFGSWDGLWSHQLPAVYIHAHCCKVFLSGGDIGTWANTVSGGIMKHCNILIHAFGTSSLFRYTLCLASVGGHFIFQTSHRWVRSLILGAYWLLTNSCNNVKVLTLPLFRLTNELRSTWADYECPWIFLSQEKMSFKIITLRPKW